MSVFLILILPLLLLFIPIWFQVVVGKRTLNQQKNLKYVLVTTGSLILEVFMTILGLIISLEGQQMKGIKCASPGVIVLGFFTGVILVVVIIVQLLSNKSRINE